MRKITAIVAMTLPVLSLADQVLYYPGDPVDSGGFPAGSPGSALNLRYEVGTSKTNYIAYEEFSVPAPGWTINKMFYLGGMQVNIATMVNVEIRQDLTIAGVFLTSSGTVVASAHSLANVVYVAPSAPSTIYPLYRMEVTGLNFNLPPGTYWAKMWPSTPNHGNGMSHVSPSFNPPNSTPGSSLRSIVTTKQDAGTNTTAFSIGDGRDYCIGMIGEPSGATVSGVIDLQFWTPDESGQVVTFDLSVGGTVVESKNVTLGAGGAFSFSTTQTGTVDLFCKGSHWLRKNLGSVVVAAANNVTGSLINGDVDGDNVISIFDYIGLSDAFDSTPSDSNWLSGADLDGDLVVSIFDYIVLSDHFDLEGDI